MMQLLPDFFLCGCCVLITLKFAQGRTRVEGSLITALQMVPMRIVKIEHTSGIYHIEPARTVCACQSQVHVSPFRVSGRQYGHLAQPKVPGIRMSVLPVTRTQYKEYARVPVRRSSLGLPSIKGSHHRQSHGNEE